MERTDDRICPEARPYLVVAIDKASNGYGIAQGAPDVVAYACFSQAHRQAMASAVRDNPRLVRIRMVDTHDRAYYPRNCGHLHIYADEPEEGTPEYRVKHLCELAIRNEKDLYNQAMRTFRLRFEHRRPPYVALANAIQARVRSPTWTSDPDVTGMPHATATRIALEVAHEYRAERLSDDPSEDFSEAI